jgi:hypothetical protein
MEQTNREKQTSTKRSSAGQKNLKFVINSDYLIGLECCQANGKASNNNDNKEQKHHTADFDAEQQDLRIMGTFIHYLNK